MKTTARLKRMGWAATVLLAGAGVICAQSGPGAQTGPGAGGAAVAGPDDAMGFVGFEAGLVGKTVTGAPFSADFSNETVQTLPDGNHIDNKTSGTVARDSEGRTRRDVTLPLIGAFATANNGGAPPHAIVISDPVADVSYVLNVNRKEAREVKLLRNLLRGNGPPRQGGQNPNVTTQPLGSQMIAGVLAEGTRTIRTIPAGQIGNDKPIELTVDRWYSSDLQTDVLIKRTDLRGGTTTFQLTNIVRAEPDASLFQVPSDYTIVQGRGPGRFGPGRRGATPTPLPPAQQ